MQAMVSDIGFERVARVNHFGWIAFNRSWNVHQWIKPAPLTAGKPQTAVRVYRSST